VRLTGVALDTIRRHRMLDGGETVLVAVSGGADSVALLHVLRALANDLALRLHVAHVDHGLRPDSSRDADFVRALAERCSLPVEIARVTITAEGESLEAAARAMRYGALESIADRVGADRIAVAHTADDQAETVLMRLLEGAGPRGLAGIPAVRGRIIRPLLAARRAEIVAALTAEGEGWIEDPSNRDPRFVRNRIRHRVLPALAAENPDIVPALLRTARLAREATDALARVAADELAAHAVIDADTVTLPIARLQALPAPIATEVLHQAAARLGARAPLRAWAHRGLRRVIGTPPPRRPFKLGGVIVEVSGGRVRLAARPGSHVEPRTLTVPGSTALPEVGLSLEATVVAAAGYDVPRDRRRVAFDADRLPATLAVRARRAGDRFAPFGGGESRVKALLINEKVPRWARPAVPIVEGDGRILWVAGVRRSDAAPIGPATRRVLELTLVPLAESASGR
jgi:tRNA(Ile)-lysidine synthase